MNQEEKEMIGQLENMIKEKGTVLIAMVHPHVYGPLRGLNFILQNPNAMAYPLAALGQK